MLIIGPLLQERQTLISSASYLSRPFLKKIVFDGECSVLEGTSVLNSDRSDYKSWLKHLLASYLFCIVYLTLKPLCAVCVTKI